MKARMVAAAGLLVALKGGPLESLETAGPLRDNAQLQGRSGHMLIKRCAIDGSGRKTFDVDKNKGS